MTETTATTTGTLQSQTSPQKHRAIHTLQEIMSADETMTGLPPRVPQSRLPGGRRQRGVLASIENIGNDKPAQEEQPARRRRRKSDFDVWKDEIMQRKESSFETATAVIDASPASLKNVSPKSYKYQNRNGSGKTKEIEALEEEYLNGGRRKLASPITEETEDVEESADEEVTTTIPNYRKQSISTLLLAHSRPNPAMTPFPTPPLSLLHRKFSSIDSSPQPSPHLPPSPVLPSYKPSVDPSPLQQMRAFRVHFESLLPSPRPTPRPPPSSPPQPRRQPPPPSPPSPHNQSYPPSPSPSHQKPPPPSSLTTKYAFTLPHLPALTHHSRTAILTLTPTTPSTPGSITLQLRNLAELKGGGTHTYHIPAHGLPITITEHTSGSSRTYTLEDLPLKHLPAVRYARHFVDVAKRGTVVGRVEVRERRGGGVWVGRRWGDGRFEVVREGEDGGVRIEVLTGDRRVRVFRGGREVQGEGKRWRRIIGRARRMYVACEKALEEEEAEGEDEEDEDDGGRKRSEKIAEEEEEEEERMPDLDKPFRIDSTTTFVPSVGWCRRSEYGWWSMLFLDGVRLEIDPGNGDAVWVEKSGIKRVLERGMEMRRVRGRVRRFVDQGL